MKKKSVRKLELNRETLRSLARTGLDHVAGGEPTDPCTRTHRSGCCEDSLSCPATCDLLFSCATCMLAGCG